MDKLTIEQTRELLLWAGICMLFSLALYHCLMALWDQKSKQDLEQAKTEREKFQKFS